MNETVDARVQDDNMFYLVNGRYVKVTDLTKEEGRSFIDSGKCTIGPKLNDAYKSVIWAHSLRLIERKDAQENRNHWHPRKPK